MEKIGIPGLVASIGMSLFLLILTLLCFTPPGAAGDMGLCLSSPNEWQLPKFIGWAMNAALIYISTAVMYSANNRYSFIPSADYVLPALMAILLACTSVTTATISTSTILMATNIVALYILFETYESYNATRQYFIMASLISIGSMFQYAFVMMIPVYIAGGVIMKSLHIREIFAFLFGLFASYWIFFGLGIVPFSALQMPDGLTIFNKTQATANDIFITVLITGLTALIGLVASFYNSVRLLSRNARVRCMHITVNIMGYICVLCLIFNFNNFLSYAGTLALWVAIEIALLLELYEVRHPRIWVGSISAIFLILYFCCL